MVCLIVLSLSFAMVFVHTDLEVVRVACLVAACACSLVASVCWLNHTSQLQYLESRVKALEHVGRSRAHGEMTSMQHLATDGEQTPASPVKVGDYVWVYDEFMWGLIPCQVDRPYHCRCGEDGGCTFETFFADSDFGKTVFLTREEAEKALAERSDDNGN